MGKIVNGLFGGGDAAKKAAEASRATQQVANDRQLASLARDEAKASVSRRAPRGRRLFEAGENSLAQKLGE